MVGVWGAGFAEGGGGGVEPVWGFAAVGGAEGVDLFVGDWVGGGLERFEWAEAAAGWVWVVDAEGGGFERACDELDGCEADVFDGAAGLGLGDAELGDGEVCGAYLEGEDAVVRGAVFGGSGE